MQNYSAKKERKDKEGNHAIWGNIGGPKRCYGQWDKPDIRKQTSHLFGESKIVKFKEA